MDLLHVLTPAQDTTPMHPFPGTALAALIVVLLSVVGLGGWLLRHVFSVTLPEQRATFLTVLQYQREESRAALAALLEHQVKQTGAVLGVLEQQAKTLEALAQEIRRQ